MNAAWWQNTACYVGKIHLLLQYSPGRNVPRGGARLLFIFLKALSLGINSKRGGEFFFGEKSMLPRVFAENSCLQAEKVMKGALTVARGVDGDDCGVSSAATLTPLLTSICNKTYRAMRLFDLCETFWEMRCMQASLTSVKEGHCAYCTVQVQRKTRC